MEIRLKRKWEAAHRFCEPANRTSKCAQPHGHTWYVEAAISRETPKLDPTNHMLVRFEDAKQKWHHWIDHHVDHSFMANINDPILTFLKEDNPEGRLLLTPGDPTTELLCALFKSKLEAFLKEVDTDIYVTYLKIEETLTNSVYFDGDCKNYLPTSNTSSNWWQRSDYSTQD